MARKKKVEFVLQAPEAKAVAVAGTFNEWDAARTPLKRSGDGTWKALVSLPTGRHEYRFVVDDEWVTDPKAKETVTNPHGSDNSVLVV